MYGDPQQKQQIGITGTPLDRPVGTLDNLRDAVNGMAELHARLVQLNGALRGLRPAASEGQKQPPRENSLASHVTQIHEILRECHSEINEAYTSLGV